MSSVKKQQISDLIKQYNFNKADKLFFNWYSCSQQMNPRLSFIFSDKSDIASLTNQRGEFVDTVDFLPDESTDLTISEKLISFTRWPFPMEPQFDPLNLLIPTIFHCRPVGLS